MGLRDRLRKLEREAEEEMIAVPQPDGTVKRFPASVGMEALLALTDGRDHPLAQAVRVSPDPKWQRTFYNAFPINPDEVEDLSE
jgi:hypothetical protein